MPARGQSHLLFGACVGSGEREAAAENAAALLGGAQQGTGSGAGSDSQAVWEFLQAQQLADLVTLRCEVRPAPYVVFLASFPTYLVT